MVLAKKKDESSWLVHEVKLWQLFLAMFSAVSMAAVPVGVWIRYEATQVARAEVRAEASRIDALMLERDTAMRNERMSQIEGIKTQYQDWDKRLAEIQSDIRILKEMHMRPDNKR